MYFAVTRTTQSELPRPVSSSLKAPASKVELSRKQLENSQMPFVVLVKGTPQSTNPLTAPCRLENQGYSSAINVEGTITRWMDGEAKNLKQCIGAGSFVEVALDKGISEAHI
jgi:hypothetical protein